MFCYSDYYEIVERAVLYIFMKRLVSFCPRRKYYVNVIFIGIACFVMLSTVFPVCRVK